MEKKEIVQDLSRLLDEIDRLPLDDEERRRLHKLVGDIEGHVDAPDETEHPSELAETLDTLITRFETDHPAFTGVLRRVMNTLGSMGV
jgi:hypothetical protein